MKYEYVKLEVRRVYLLCDTCNERLEFKEGGFMTYPPKAWYECKNGHREMHHDGYPTIEYIEVK